MGKFRNAIWSLCLLAVLCQSVTAAAEGIIRVVCTHGESPVSGGSLQIFHVADENFQLLPAFAGSEAELGEDLSAGAAEKLAGWASETGALGHTEKVSDQGEAVFTGLSPGVYLLAQQTPPTGYLPIRPFLVCIRSPGGLHVEAHPKLQPKPDIPDLPSTGDRLYAALPAALAGMAFSAAGIFLCIFMKKAAH